jgi:N-acetylneuraminic acid mutarotase
MGGCCSKKADKQVDKPQKLPPSNKGPTGGVLVDPKTQPNSNIIKGNEPVPVVVLGNVPPQHDHKIVLAPVGESGVNTASSQNNRPHEPIVEIQNWNKVPAIARQGSAVTSDILNIRMSNCYFFGNEAKDDVGDQIVKFDPTHQSCERVKPPANMQIFNFSSCLYMSELLIYVSGGMKDENLISNHLYQYNALNNTAEALPSFMIKRFGHMCNYKDDHIFLIGGVGGNHERLKSCERYSVKEKKWATLADLNDVRAFGTCMVYNNELYVFGGTNKIDEDQTHVHPQDQKPPNSDRVNQGQKDKYSETKKIEKYDEAKNKWIVLDIKLPLGLKFHYVCSTATDEIQIIGGQTLTGTLNVNLVFNIKDATYSMKKYMDKERSAHKGMVYESSIIIFGGDTDESIEEYDIPKEQWKGVPSSQRHYVENIQVYGYSSPPLYVRASNEPKFDFKEKSEPNDRVSFVFGDDYTSFILEVNWTKKFTKEYSVPFNLKLLGYQGALKVSGGNYFLHGGVDYTLGYISAKTYLYHPETNKATKLPKSNFERYTYSIISKGDYVYAIGGRNYGDDDVTALLKVCERYNLKTNKWDRIGDLQEARCSATTFVHKNQIYIAGGYAGNKQRLSSIERYSEELNLWEKIRVQLNIEIEGQTGPMHSGLEASCVVKGREEGRYYFVGGRTYSKDSETIWAFNIEDGNTWPVGTLKESKSLHKVCEIESGKICIFGGQSRLVEFFDLDTKMGYEDNFGSNVEDTINGFFYTSGRTENKFVRQSIA